MNQGMPNCARSEILGDGAEFLPGAGQRPRACGDVDAAGGAYEGWAMTRIGASGSTCRNFIA